MIAISIGGMLGSGIFVLPGLAAAKTGPSVWLAYLIAAICILPAALSKSELATAMPSSGGTYVYIERTFGPLFGTIAGLGLWLSLLLKSSFALVGVSAYLMVVVNLQIGITKYIALFFLIIICVLNILGVKKVGNVQIVIVKTGVAELADAELENVNAKQPKDVPNARQPKDVPNVNARPEHADDAVNLGVAYSINGRL